MTPEPEPVEPEPEPELYDQDDDDTPPEAPEPTGDEDLGPDGEPLDAEGDDT